MQDTEGIDSIETLFTQWEVKDVRSDYNIILRTKPLESPPAGERRFRDINRNNSGAALEGDFRKAARTASGVKQQHSFDLIDRPTCLGEKPNARV
jgi:hypothetical protein